MDGEEVQTSRSGPLRLWTIANDRMIHDRRSSQFAGRRRQLGDSRNDTLRVLKRCIARKTFTLIHQALINQTALPAAA